MFSGTGQRTSLLETLPFCSHTPFQLRCGSEPCHQPRSNKENKSIERKCSLLPAVGLQFNLPPWSGEISSSSAEEDTVPQTLSWAVSWSQLLGGDALTQDSLVFPAYSYYKISLRGKTALACDVNDSKC